MLLQTHRNRLRGPCLRGTLTPDTGAVSMALTRYLWRAGAVLCIAALAALLAGCATPEGGSSIPWARPEPWENQPNLMPGVRF